MVIKVKGSVEQKNIAKVTKNSLVEEINRKNPTEIDAFVSELSSLEDIYPVLGVILKQLYVLQKGNKRKY